MPFPAHAGNAGSPFVCAAIFPYFDLLQWLPGAEELLQPLEAIRLSIFPQLDAYLERHCDNIAERYSKKAGFLMWRIFVPAAICCRAVR